jgi:transcriptional regulator with XRE-family HTH domain
MDNHFGNMLKQLITDNGTKANIVSEKLGYDPTYLSKWITGKNLPSEKNIDSICEKLSRILSAGKNQDKIKSGLIDAYYSDLGFSTLERNMNKNISVVTSDVDVIGLIMDILRQLEYSGVKDITINTTLNLFQEYEYHMEEIISTLHKMNLNSLKLNTCGLFSNNAYDHLIFCNNILSLTSGNYFIDFNIYKQKEELPKVLVINDVFAMNIVHLKNVVFLCYYSFDKEYVESIINSFNLIIPHLEKVLSYVMPISLRKTNVQINHFLQNNISILFSESPAILLPKDILDCLIANNELNIEGKDWEDHVNYLTQISNAFEKYTKHNNIRILIYESMLLQYINSGVIEIGGHKHKFTKEQIIRHILYICDCMAKNENIEFYTISDTINFDTYNSNPPSVFFSPTSVAVGNTNIYTDEQSYNYYFSTEKSIINIFGKYLDTIIEKSSCVKISADRLATYAE